MTGSAGLAYLVGALQVLCKCSASLAYGANVGSFLPHMIFGGAMVFISRSKVFNVTPGGHPGVLACFKWIHECTHVWLIHVCACICVCAYMINPMRSCEYVYLACACTGTV